MSESTGDEGESEDGGGTPDTTEVPNGAGSSSGLGVPDGLSIPGSTILTTVDAQPSVQSITVNYIQPDTQPNIQPSTLDDAPAVVAVGPFGPLDETIYDPAGGAADPLQSMQNYYTLQTPIPDPALLEYFQNFPVIAAAPSAAPFLQEQTEDSDIVLPAGVPEPAATLSDQILATGEGYPNPIGGMQPSPVTSQVGDMSVVGFVLAATGLALIAPFVPVALAAEGLEEVAVTSAFWSGGLSVAGTAAQEFGQTLEQSPLGQAAQELADALDASGALYEQIREEVWEPTSQMFAQMAEGITQALINNLNPNSVWATTEYPTLANNPAISQIIINYMEGAPITPEQWFQYGDAWASGASIP